MRKPTGVYSTDGVRACRQFDRSRGRAVVACGIRLEGADKRVAAIEEVDGGNRRLTLPGVGDDTELIVGRLVGGQEVRLLFVTTDKTHEATHNSCGGMNEMFHNFVVFVSKKVNVNSGGR